MDIGKAFTYVFEDEDWVKKVLIGGVINLIPIVGLLFTSGYMLETLKNVMEGHPLPLPEWDDWGGKFMKGLMAAIIGLVYSLPVIVLTLCFTGVCELTLRPGRDGRLPCHSEQVR